MKLNKQSKLVYDFFIKEIDKLKKENFILQKELFNKNLEFKMLNATFNGFMKGLRKKE